MGCASSSSQEADTAPDSSYKPSSHHHDGTPPINVNHKTAAAAGSKPVSPAQRTLVSPAVTTTTATSHPSRSDYHIVKTLGEGASGKVLSVRDSHGVHYAMKVLIKGLDNDNQQLYRNEIDILKRLKHKNLLEFVSAFEEKNSFNILTVLYTGGELFDQVAKGSFSERIASRLAAEMLSALQYCHEHHVVHRDLKPENFVFETNSGARYHPDPHHHSHHHSNNNNNNDDNSNANDNPLLGHLKLIDFGCAKLCVNKSAVIADVAGSPYYCAPEVLNNPETPIQQPHFHATAAAAAVAAGVDYRCYERTGYIWECSDMWSVGVIIFLLVSGYPPFNGETQNSIFAKIKKGKFRFPDFLSPSVKNLISSLLVMDPTHRLTATQALQHEWIAGNTATDTPLPDALVTALRAFSTQCKLKKAVARVLSNRMTAEDKASLAVVFKQFDTNGDGALTADEIAAMMQQIGKGTTAATATAAAAATEAAAAFLADADADGDGHVTLTEFQDAVVQRQLNNSSELELRAAFDLFDLDGDGYVSQSELERVCDFLTPAAVAELIAEVDSNTDGRINFHEWIDAMHGMQTRVEGAATAAATATATAAK